MGKAKQPSTQDDGRRDWHRLFALAWLVLLKGQPVEVDWEFETTRTVQYLDVLIVRTGKKRITVPLPDGFEPLATHNLITFKSHHEALNGEVLEELICHYVNYRKHVSEEDNPLSASEFRLFAVCVRFPHNNQHLLNEKVSEGVYRIRPLSQEITVVVVSQLPLAQRNALMCLFSATAEQVQYGRRNYTIRSDESRTMLRRLFEQYFKETDMPRDIKEAFRQLSQEIWDGMTPEEREEFADKLSPEQRRAIFAKLPPEDRLAGMKTDDLLKALSPEEREALRRRLNAETPPETK